MTLDSIEKLFVFLVTLSLLIVIHEGGHYWVARWCKVAVTEFALGFGPSILSWRSKSTGTRYRLNILPLGGYCAMKGEEGAQSEIEARGEEYRTRTPLQRFAIVAAGPIVNLVAAFLILVANGVLVGTPDSKASTVVGYMVPGMPAEKAGLHTGDTILSIDGKPIADGREMVHTINASLGHQLRITYRRGDEQRTVVVTPVASQQNGKRIAITGFSPLTLYRRVPPVTAVVNAGRDISEMFNETVQGFADLIRKPARAQEEMVGPVGMARAAVAIQDYGIGAYLWFAALISMSLGIFNLLPIPALDGGRLMFIIAEALRGRPVAADKEALVHLTGFAAIIAFVLFRTYHDVLNAIAHKPIF